MEILAVGKARSEKGEDLRSVAGVPACLPTSSTTTTAGEYLTVSFFFCLLLLHADYFGYFIFCSIHREEEKKRNMFSLQIVVLLLYTFISISILSIPADYMSGREK